MPDDLRYSIAELAALAGVTPRTVRYYLAQGLIPSPGATGPGVKYGDEVLDRLRLIRRLQREHLPLAEIRSRLAGLDGGDIARLTSAAAGPSRPSERDIDAPDSALDYIRRLLEPPPVRQSLLRRMAVGEAPAQPLIPSSSAMRSVAPPTPEATEPPGIERSQWERITLAQDVELHVRRPLPRPISRKVDRLVTIARELLEEDPS